MLVAYKAKTSLRFNAWQANKQDGPFCCPVCKEEVIIHKGMVRAHHFAHKPDSNCRHGAGETELHRRAKMELYCSLSSAPGLECELEAPLDGVRADLLVRSINTKRAYAIEVQISQLTMAQIIERTRRYARIGVYVLWLFEWTRDLLSERYSPSLKERWAHALNYGWVYYWREDDEVIPIKFDKHLIHRSATTWFEEGEEQNAGGYDYVSKRYRTPRRGKSLRISSDFQGVTRQAWAGGDIVIPACRILTARSL